MSMSRQFGFLLSSASATAGIGVLGCFDSAGQASEAAGVIVSAQPGIKFAIMYRGGATELWREVGTERGEVEVIASRWAPTLAPRAYQDLP